jgi:hypothetical protein
MTRGWKVFIAAALLGACSSNTTAPAPDTYRADVRGSLQRTLAGPASVVIGQSGYGQPVVTLVLGAQSARDRIALTIGRGTLPPVGTYAVATYATEPPGDKWTAAYVYDNGSKDATYTSVTGQVRVTESSDRRLRGSFSFTGQAGTAGGSVTVEGVFDAPLGTR